jgi:epoxyqueuosine reductase QueG
MADDLKRRLIDEMMRVGAYEVRMADPNVGFDHARPGQHPLEIMPECRTVVVFGVAKDDLADTMYVGVRRSVAREPDDWTVNLAVQDPSMYLGQRVSLLFPAYVILKAHNLLSQAGFRIVERFDKASEEPKLPLKLCAFEAGLGVYGRSGLILHRELGNRMVLGGFLTDAPMSPDGRSAEDPCADCRLCLASCPAGAYGPNGEYHDCWSRERCESTRKRLIAKGYSNCNLCWEVCPAGTVDRDSLFAFGAVRHRPLERLLEMSKATIAARRRDLVPGESPQ